MLGGGRQGWPEGHLGRHEEDLRLSRATGDRWSEAAARCNLGIVLHVQGHFEEALGEYDHSLVAAHGIGDRELEGYGLGDLGTLQRDLGRLGPARTHLEAQRALAARTGARRCARRCRSTARSRRRRRSPDPGGGEPGGAPPPGPG